MAVAATTSAPVRLTPRQRVEVLRLWACNAVSLETAASPFDPGMRGYNQMVIGALRSLGLADSRVARQGRGHQWTEYWLTPAGVALAEQLAMA